MAVMREKTTGEKYAVKQIEDDVQIARWLVGRNLIEPPLPFEEAPHVGDPGDWAVSHAVDGVWVYEIVTGDEYEERFEKFPLTGD